MRPHLLTLSAFGPFPGEETVDFDDLGAAGLLLLHGPTGAGKTSVLDAVGFALYGVVPGERGVKGLRSEHAEPDAETSVTLEFSAGGRRHRLRRTPRQEVAKQRGEGTTVRQPTGLLERHDGGGWVTVSTRLDEIGDTVGDLVGLTAEQFFQVVLLPQGRFAAFLHAPAGEREKLLRTLFGTERFARVEDELSVRRRAAQEELDAVRARAAREAAALAGHARVDPAEVPTADLPAWSQGVVLTLEAELATAQAVLEQAQQAEAAALAAADAARDLAERQGRRRAAERRAAQLAEREAGAGAVRAGLARARAAVALRTDLQREQEAARELARLVDGGSAPTPDEERERALREQAAQARALLPLEAQVVRESGDLAGLTRRLGAATAAVGQAHQHLARAVDAATTAAQAELTAAEDVLRAAVDADQAAREVWLQLRERRLAGMAGELAAGLSDGQPCTVCGSVDHPAPAAPAEDAVTEADERAARERTEATAAALERARARAEAARAAAAAPGGPEVTAAQEAVASAEQQRAVLVQEQAAAAAGHAAREAQVVQARGDAPSLTVLVAALEAEADVLAAAAGLARLRAELAGPVAAAGFAGPDDARAALRGDAEMAADEEALTALVAERRSVDDQLADPALDVPLEPAADVSGATDALERTRAAGRDATREVVTLEQRLTAARACARTLDGLDRELAPVAERCATVTGLADLAAGGAGNRLKMTLSSFVLAARLETVAERASVRLATMTSGRYTLVHSDDVSDARRRSGLGLAVRDLWTGGTRPTSSLSGGETFMTALALALGLADVVAEESGGRRIDTLFVDEGFGSLDEHALDRVMEVLDGLRDGGRLVGLVSHVPEMTRRAPARLEVLRGESGSTLRPHAAPLAD